MKIDINRIPPEGLSLEEEASPGKLDLETDIIKFHKPIKITANVSKITNAITVHIVLHASMHTNCSCCLEEFDIDFKKNVDLNYALNKEEPVIELDPEIREEIILDYPLKPLCKPDCKGLCPKCGENLNEGGCSCGFTKKKTF